LPLAPPSSPARARPPFVIGHWEGSLLPSVPPRDLLLRAPWPLGNSARPPSAGRASSSTTQAKLRVSPEQVPDLLLLELQFPKSPIEKLHEVTLLLWSKKVPDTIWIRLVEHPPVPQGGSRAFSTSKLALAGWVRLVRRHRMPLLRWGTEAWEGEAPRRGGSSEQVTPRRVDVERRDPY